MVQEYSELMTQGYVSFYVMIGLIWVIFFWVRYDVEMATLLFRRKRRPRVSDYTIMVGNLDQDLPNEAVAGALSM